MDGFAMSSTPAATTTAASNLLHKLQTEVVRIVVTNVRLYQVSRVKLYHYSNLQSRCTCVTNLRQNRYLNSCFAEPIFGVARVA